MLTLIQVLLELPNVTMEVLSSFQGALAVTLGDKEQRALVKKLLVGSGGSLQQYFVHIVQHLCPSFGCLTVQHSGNTTPGWA